MNETAESPGLTDILATGLSVVFCGINPASTAAADGHHFSIPSNRFWRAIHLAGFTPVQLRPEDDRTLLQHGCGLTAAVARPTRRASDLSRSELTQSADALRQKIETYRPAILAFLGKPAYAAISGRRDIAWGRQDDRFGDTLIWVPPIPAASTAPFR